MTHGEVILFDGVCNLCNSAVQFIIPRDPKKRFRFAALQSDVGKALVNSVGLRRDSMILDSVMLIKGGKVYVKSSAALHITRGLHGLWPLAYALIIVPRSIRDAVYDYVARNRYRWFGRRDACMVPTADNRDRFIGISDVE
ncbi:thiol-disulfide oxidoreductase DCC family protein [Alicyclobacillus dauci]|uniref:Thiol-disulfide oxidoreductase DCC family protein n=1 Tax=Alicyclobacillus dauci TaxID=1475485 RepID=A0ABY6Z0L4_9BACL|nr:thiol-disulfide oxidoreductase DCC family protein [Alicyclobacillus dauci]WAH36078.1 thiol-disulfide oxidoreductase DCC family protein [Alicyclobacillus dauci]